MKRPILVDVDRGSGQQFRPYLFDDEGRAKAAFYAVQQALAKKQTVEPR